MKSGSMLRLTFRESYISYVIGALCVLEVICVILALVLPWGVKATGEEIRTGLEGVLPWFLLAPVLLQIGFLALVATVLQVLYLVTNFGIGIFVIGVHSLTYLEYGPGFQFGFYMVFVGGALVLLAGIVLVVERYAFRRLKARGKGRIIELGVTRT